MTGAPACLCFMGVSLAYAALAPSVPAVADPPPDPAAVDQAAPPPSLGYIPPRSGIGSVLAQTGSESAGPLGLPDLAGYGPGLLLAQNPVPSAPGTTVPALAPDLRAFDNSYLLPQNVTPAAPGEGTPAPGIGPDEDNPGTGRIAFLRRLHEMYQAGGLKGALLGQMPAEQLGEPLPGTAPGPGIYLAPGLGQTLPAPVTEPVPHG